MAPVVVVVGGGWRASTCVGGGAAACGSGPNGGHRSVEMRPEEQLTGELVEHEVPVQHLASSYQPVFAREPPAHRPL